jgi:16S rRNA (guanine1207-N2)-methyltransferase
MEDWGVYGSLPPGLADVPQACRQYSPLVPGSEALEDVPGGALKGVVVLAPAGRLERQYVLAQGLRALATAAAMTVLAPKDKGGMRLRKELEALGCEVRETSKSHHRICTLARPEVCAGVEAAIVAGGPQIVPAHELWSQPGVFSWDRVDPGTALLIEKLRELKGRGADLGCGFGVLARHVLRSSRVSELVLVDIDRRAIAASRRNVEDPRAQFLWADVRREDQLPTELDFIVMNPPFHDGGAEDRALGQAFIRRAAGLMRKDGVLWMTANRHLPYEEALEEGFSSVALHADRGGYKVYEARK